MQLFPINLQIITPADVFNIAQEIYIHMLICLLSLVFGSALTTYTCQMETSQGRSHMLMIPQRLVYLFALQILGLMLRIIQEYVCLDVPTIPLARIQLGNVLRDVISGVLSLIIPLHSVLRLVQRTLLLILAQ